MHIMKIPPTLVKSFIWEQSVHGAIQTCKSVEKLLQLYAEFIELHENNLFERRRERLEGNITHCHNAVATTQKEKSAQRKELVIVSSKGYKLACRMKTNQTFPLSRLPAAQG